MLSIENRRLNCWLKTTEVRRREKCKVRGSIFLSLAFYYFCFKLIKKVKFQYLIHLWSMPKKQYRWP
jgi:hypothetical protein